MVLCLFYNVMFHVFPIYLRDVGITKYLLTNYSNDIKMGFLRNMGKLVT